MPPLLFLDFDGVLITSASWMAPVVSGQPPFADPRCVEQLNRIVTATGAQIVISSTHRRIDSLTTLRDRMRDWGIEAEAIDCTPILSAERPVDRGEEIQAWLDSRGLSIAEARIVILDDGDDMAHLSHLLLQTDSKVGLTLEIANRAIRRLV